MASRLTRRRGYDEVSPVSPKSAEHLMRTHSFPKSAVGLGAVLAAITLTPPASSFAQDAAKPNTSKPNASKPNTTDSDARERWASAIDPWINDELPKLAGVYQYFHAHPEVSFEESGTAAKLADHFRDAGLTVTTGIGGHGIAGIMENGDGPIVMIRCDMDALPVREQTPLPFASTQTIELEGGGTAGVMHACGHDVHMTNVVGALRFLTGHRTMWRGTLIAIGQPAEERGAGAEAMLKDGLFERFPKPDYAIALHASADTAAGTVKLRGGYSLANVDSVDIIVKGRGGHGSQPHNTIDPIAQAAALVMDLQSIVSREIKPIEPAVVTVGAINGGTKHNIIGDHCHLQITVRSYTDEVRTQLLESIRRKAKAVAMSYRAPEPEVRISEGTPSLRNDPDLAARMSTLFRGLLGDPNVSDDEPSMGGEDFSRYGKAGVPILMYRLGTITDDRLQRYESLGIPPPSLHSAEYHPDFEPTIRTAVTTMVAATLDLMPPPTE